MSKILLIYFGFWFQVAVFCSPLLQNKFHFSSHTSFTPLIRKHEDGRAAQYYLSSHNTSWLNAKRECESSGMSLLAIKSPTIQAQVEFELNYLTISSGLFYTSGNDVQNEGTPVWGDGSRFIFENEYYGENNEDTDCMVLRRGEDERSLWKWHFVPCSEPHQFICQVVADFEDELERLRKEFDILKANVRNLEKNPVPIGYTYTQLDDDYPPRLIWPQVEWATVNENDSQVRENEPSPVIWKRVT